MVSTVGLMVFLLACASYCKIKVVDQHRAMAVLCGLFLRCMEPGIATPGGELLQLSPGTFALCGHAAGGGQCFHLHPCLLQVADAAGAQREQLAATLTQDPCEAHAGDLCGRQKRPCDEGFRRAVATKAIEQGRASSSA